MTIQFFLATDKVLGLIPCSDCTAKGYLEAWLDTTLEQDEELGSPIWVSVNGQAPREMKDENFQPFWGLLAENVDRQG